jgi:TonB family protein
MSDEKEPNPPIERKPEEKPKITPVTSRQEKTITATPIEPGPPRLLPERKREGFWQRFGTFERIIATLTLLAATLVIPEVRYFLHLEKRPEEKTTTPQPGPEPQPQPQPPQETPPDEGAPHIKYVPLPNARPLRNRGNLFTHARPPSGAENAAMGAERRTMMVNGENIEVLDQHEIREYLKMQKPSWTVFTAKNLQGSAKLFVQVGKDGKVDNVQVLEGDTQVGEAAKEAVSEWQFKPLFKDGKQVPVETVIELQANTDTKDPSKSEN